MKKNSPENSTSTDIVDALARSHVSHDAERGKVVLTASDGRTLTWSQCGMMKNATVPHVHLRATGNTKIPPWTSKHTSWAAAVEALEDDLESFSSPMMAVS